MEEIGAIIERIIAEHKVILGQTQSLEKVANDAAALQAIDQSKEAFMPGRKDNIQSLKDLEDLRMKTQEGLMAHFDFEERELFNAAQKHVSESLMDALKTLLAEHKNIRDNMAAVKTEVDELIMGNLSSHIWGAKAYDMRAHITNLHKMIENHARNEQMLLARLREEYKARSA